MMNTTRITMKLIQKAVHVDFQHNLFIGDPMTVNKNEIDYEKEKKKWPIALIILFIRIRNKY